MFDHWLFVSHFHNILKLQGAETIHFVINETLDNKQGLTLVWKDMDFVLDFGHTSLFLLAIGQFR